MTSGNPVKNKETAIAKEMLTYLLLLSIALASEGSDPHYLLTCFGLSLGGDSVAFALGRGPGGAESILFPGGQFALS